MSLITPTSQYTINVVPGRLGEILNTSQTESTELITCSSVQDLEAYFIQTIPNETLVLLDIDFTLTMPTNPILQKKTLTENWDLVKKTFASLTEEGTAIFSAMFVIETEPMLVDPDFPNAIRNMQSRGVQVIALSSSVVGEIESQKIEEKRYQGLKNLGIDFSSSFPNREEIHFNQLVPTLGEYPIFYKGLALTNREKISKGDFVIELLKALNWTPKNVLFVEDMGHHRQSIQNSMKTIRTPCQIVAFNGALKHPETSVSKEEFEKCWNNLLAKAAAIASKTRVAFYK